MNAFIPKTPKTSYSNYYDIARFNLTWNFSLILAVFLPVLTIIIYNLGANAAYPAMIGIVAIYAILIILKKSKNYVLSAKLYSIIGLILSQYTLNFFPEAIHFVDPMWMMIIVLYTYFTLGKIWGSINLGLALIGVSYFILFNFELNLNVVTKSNFGDLIALTLNFIICTAINAYLIFQFIKLNQYAEDKFINLTQELNAKNKEKTVLIKEIHHRVKNNLQVIISLLRLQSNEIENKELQKPFTDSINRVISMSLIHEKIYQTPDLATINLEEYIKTLSLELISSLSVNTAVKFNIDSNVRTINPKSLVPIALIFNELITNSLKHGFKDVKEGQITIEIRDQFPNISMVYTDNGTWVPKTGTTSLGLDLIDSLTDQLSGTVVKTIESGTKYNFNFVYD